MDAFSLIGQAPPRSGPGFGLGTFGQNSNPTAHQPTTVNTGAGSLYVRDTFTPSFGDLSTPHGLSVMQAAGQQAGEGATPRFNPSMGDQPSMVGSMPFLNPELGRLDSETLTREQARSVLGGQLDREVTTFVDDQTSYLGRLNEAGVENSAVNLSLGDSKAAQSYRLYFNTLESLGSENPQRRENFARAFDVNMDNMRSQDKEVQRAEDSRLQQSVVDFVSQSVDQSRPIAQSQDRWDQAVEKFEGNRNSVVISSGNEGVVEETMERFTGNRQLNLPRDFETNFLENDLVTSVGATNPDGTRAEYSSESGGVDIYANGPLGGGEGQEPITGTSFAAPRVGVTMAELHRLNPNMSSSQVEGLLQSRFTQPLENGNSGAAPVLRPDVSYEFLRNQTF